MSRRNRAFRLTVAAAILSGVAVLAEAARPQSAGPPLSGLPSAPGAHVATVQALGDNEWMQLPLPAADPAWGRPGGRSWGSRAAYAPELRAGFIYGEGNHGWWNEQTRRYMDDLWAYDALANRWICLYPGAHVDNLSLSLDANGFEVDSTGQPIPVAQNVHGYELLTYDTDRRKFLWMPATPGYDAILDPLRRSWGAQAGYVPSNCSPWTYNVATGKFELRKSTGDNPVSGFGDVLVYLPSIRKVLLWTGAPTQANWDYVWIYDPDANTWTRRTPTGPSPFGSIGGDTLACYDSRRDRVYLCQSGVLWAYDVQANAWMNPQPANPPDISGTNECFMNYDSVNDAAVLVQTNRAPFGTFVYDPASNAWTRASTSVPGGMAWSKNAFYDPVLNAHFVHAAQDNYPGEMWVYRYKRSGAPPAGDTDGDGLPDAWETQHFGNITSQNGSGDPDSDGLTNAQEQARGTNPTVADTDGDGASDGQEVASGTDPLNPASVPGSTAGGGGGKKKNGSCGATGLEALLVLGVFAGRARIRSILFLLILACPLAAQQAKPKGPAGAHPKVDQAKVDAAIRK